MHIFLLTNLQHRSIIAEMKAEMKDLQKELLQLTYNSSQHEKHHETLPSSSHNTLVTPPAPGALQQSQYGTVKFWTKASWQEYVDRAKNRNSGREPTLTECITDEKGVQISKQRLKELWEDAKIAWNSLYYRRLDPSTWSKKHTTAADYFYNTILQKYPEFRLCDGNWKLQMWATKRYADWTKNVRGGSGLSRMFPYIQFIFYSSLNLQGADPSIIQVGGKRPSNGMERDDKASKKARPVKKETDAQKKPPPLATGTPPPPVIHPKLIVVDDDSDSDNFLEYCSESERKKSVDSDVVGGHQAEVRRMKKYMCIHNFCVIGSPNVG
jgi:hypothetical protein